MIGTVKQLRERVLVIGRIGRGTPIGAVKLVLIRGGQPSASRLTRIATLRTRSEQQQPTTPSTPFPRIAA